MEASEDQPLLTFADLMDIPVTVKSETVPVFMSLMTRAATENSLETPNTFSNSSDTTAGTTISSPSESKSYISNLTETTESGISSRFASPTHNNADILNNKNSFEINEQTKFCNQSSSPLHLKDHTSSVVDEVTIPLRDVLSLMLFVASCEQDETELINEEEEEYEDEVMNKKNLKRNKDGSIPPSPTATCDPRESMPLLRDIFSRKNKTQTLANQRKNLSKAASNNKTQLTQEISLEHALENYLKEESGENCVEGDEDESSTQDDTQSNTLKNIV